MDLGTAVKIIYDVIDGKFIDTAAKFSVILADAFEDPFYFAAIRGENQIGLMAMLFLFAVVWSTDILAYFIGRKLKGPKLAPRISPGKTWSGAIRRVA